MWIIVFSFLGRLGIFGYLYTSHYILLIYAPLLQRAASGSSNLLASLTTSSCRRSAYQQNNSDSSFCTYLHTRLTLLERSSLGGGRTVTSSKSGTEVVILNTPPVRVGRVCGLAFSSPQERVPLIRDFHDCCDYI